MLLHCCWMSQNWYRRKCIPGFGKAKHRKLSDANSLDNHRSARKLLWSSYWAAVGGHAHSHLERIAMAAPLRAVAQERPPDPWPQVEGQKKSNSRLGEHRSTGDNSNNVFANCYKRLKSASTLFWTTLQTIACAHALLLSTNSRLREHRSGTDEPCHKTVSMSGGNHVAKSLQVCYENWPCHARTLGQIVMAVPTDSAVKNIRPSKQQDLKFGHSQLIQA